MAARAASNAVCENVLERRYAAPGNALSRVKAEAAYFPRVSDNKTAALSRPIEYAIRWPYIQINRRDFVSWMVFDCDHGDIFKWETAGLPPPNLIVASGGAGQVASFHVLYAIDPVCTSSKARAHPIRYMKAIYAEMARLLGADPDYHGGPVCKTPGHPWWHTAEFHAHQYSLGELHEYVEIPAEKPRFSKGADLAPLMHSRALVLFERLRFFAYGIVNAERERGTFESFTRRLEDFANQVNDFGRQGFLDPRTREPKGDLAVSDMRSAVKSVARWTWDFYTGDGRCNRGVMQLDKALPLAERQRLSAERTHGERTKRTLEAIQVASAHLVDQGKKLTQTAIAAVAKLSRQTVATYQRLIRDADAQAVGTPPPTRSEHGPSLRLVKFGAHQVSTPSASNRMTVCRRPVQLRLVGVAPPICFDSS